MFQGPGLASMNQSWVASHHHQVPRSSSEQNRCQLCRPSSAWVKDGAMTSATGSPAASASVAGPVDADVDVEDTVAVLEASPSAPAVQQDVAPPASRGKSAAWLSWGRQPAAFAALSPSSLQPSGVDMRGERDGARPAGCHLPPSCCHAVADGLRCQAPRLRRAPTSGPVERARFHAAQAAGPLAKAPCRGPSTGCSVRGGQGAAEVAAA